jgi:hypothetical protein
MTLESRVGRGDHIGYDFKGWFVAPATTRYRFSMTCDDVCRLFLDDTPGSTDNQTKILDTAYGGYRRFHYTADNRKRVSDWVNLTEGEHYYINAQHGEWTGGDHLTVAVEIERDNSSAAGHHHSVREVQTVEIKIENNKDTFRVTVDNPDSGKYLLNF